MDRRNHDHEAIHEAIREAPSTFPPAPSIWRESCRRRRCVDRDEQPAVPAGDRRHRARVAAGPAARGCRSARPSSCSCSSAHGSSPLCPSPRAPPQPRAPRTRPTPASRVATRACTASRTPVRGSPSPPPVPASAGPPRAVSSAPGSRPAPSRRRPGCLTLDQTVIPQSSSTPSPTTFTVTGAASFDSTRVLRNVSDGCRYAMPNSLALGGGTGGRPGPERQLSLGRPDLRHHHLLLTGGDRAAHGVQVSMP